MKRSPHVQAFFSLLATALLLLAASAPAHAAPGDWVLPWTALDHGYLSRVTISNSDIPETLSKMDVSAGGVQYTGYWHGTDFTFQSMLQYNLTVAAPASGTVMDSTQAYIGVQTDDGDQYSLMVYGSNSTMDTFAAGTRIRMGDAVGEVYLLDPSPKLRLEYLVTAEPVTLFGVPRYRFTNGTDLKDMDCALYTGAVLPDLAADAITVSGTQSPNLSGADAAIVWEPQSWLLFDTGITNLSAAAAGQTFNIKWFINGAEVGYGAHEGVPGYADASEGNSSLWWSFAPGTYRVEFWVDCDNTIQEADDTNNRSETWIVVGY